VTDEEDFQRHLDERPGDHLARQVFADWLQDRGDPRAEGYRALGVMRRDCTQEGAFLAIDTYRGTCPYWGHYGHQILQVHHLPGDWFSLLEVAGRSDCNAPSWSQRFDATRRELDDAAAIAFSRLPPERRAEILSGALLTETR
jgi:uncharacterized protein (TIGR02996 family)